ncbi:MAG: peptidoglycan-associated lipoprotein Pal [Deltaproteobacteria bacterium]|jgi:peptidoglycan-associated lipoprotein|nr:peptidoglycan-associated lipoprotein Pal [Deltaproteobacteria bacterium]
MQKKLWLKLILLLIIPGFLFTVSCTKKAVTSDVDMTQPIEDEDLKAKEAAEKTRQEELARQRAIEEERLKEAAAKREGARNQFLTQDIYFDFDSFSILPEAQEILSSKAEWLQNNPDATVTIEGHCDERGTIEYNLALGDRRGESAKAFLVNLGIAESRLNTISYGEERPLDPDNNEDAWGKNRRAHFVTN